VRACVNSTSPDWTELEKCRENVLLSHRQLKISISFPKSTIGNKNIEIYVENLKFKVKRGEAKNIDIDNSNSRIISLRTNYII
jgi:hypothetical protein